MVMFGRVNEFLKGLRNVGLNLMASSHPTDAPWHITSEILISLNPKFAKYSVGKFSYGAPNE